MESKSINLIPERTAPVFHVSQNDADRDIRLNLFEGAKVVTLSGTESVRVRYKKPDGSIGSFGVTNTSNTYVDVTIPSSVTDKVGRVYCKLKINGLGYKAFYIDVEVQA